MTRANWRILTGALLLAAGGLAIPLAVIVPRVAGPAEEVVFRAPGSASLDVEAAGRFYLWHDYETMFEGERYVRNESLPDGYRIEIRHQGRPLTFEANDSISTSGQTSSSRSIGFVEIPSAGRIEIEVTGGDDRTRILSFSRARIWKILTAIGIGLLSVLLIGGAGMVLLVIGIIDRMHDRP